MTKKREWQFILDQPDEKLRNYNADDCEATYFTGTAQKDEMVLLKAQKTHDLMLAMAPAVYRMQERGLPVDADKRADMRSNTNAVLQQYVIAINEAFEAVVGEEFEAVQAIISFFRRFFNKRRRNCVALLSFNVGSKDHMIFLLHRLGFKWDQTTPSGKSQLDLDIVMKLRREHGDKPHAELLKAYWEFCKLNKVRQDWLDEPKDGKLLCDDGRLRASIRVTGTQSGRLSESTREWCARCQKPNHGRNRQNTPRSDDEITAQVAPIRKFIAAPPGRVLIERDYSALEGWLAAILSGDPIFLERLRSGDIHRMNGADIFRVLPEAVTKLQRNMAKIFLYGGVLYEGGAETIRSSFEEHGLIVPLADVKVYQARWKVSHHRYVGWCHRLVQEAQREKPMAVYTALGRRRNFIGEPKSWRRDAIAHVISGTGADHTNIALCELDAMGYDVVLHGHDSIILEVDNDPRAIADAVADSKLAFETDRGIGCLRSEAKVGHNLGEMTPWREAT